MTAATLEAFMALLLSCGLLLRLPLCHVHLVERRAQAARRLLRVVVCPEVHEEEARAFGQHVERRYLYAAVSQGADDRIDLARSQHEVARDGGLAPARRLEVDGRRQAHRGRHLHASVRDGLGARDAELVDAAVHFAALSHELVELLGIYP